MPTSTLERQLLAACANSYQESSLSGKLQTQFKSIQLSMHCPAAGGSISVVM